MNLPPAQDIYATTEATWPCASRQTIGPWVIRSGLKGGQRVSATTALGPVYAHDLPKAEAAMTALNQPLLFMIRAGDTALDILLARAGYCIKDPVFLYACPVEMLANPQPARLSAFPVWPPLEIINKLWDQGGIGPARRAVMARAPLPKTAILARQNDRAAGVGFVAIHKNIAMLHALEVTPSQRRQGVADNIMRVAALWAQDHGAEAFAVAATQANAAANCLYTSLNMENMGHYHYRIKAGNTALKE